MDISKIIIKGSGFGDREYSLYEFHKLKSPDAAMSYMSFEQNHKTYQPLINSSHEKYILEDKWLTALVLSKLGIPTPSTLGLYHPLIGFSERGSPLRTAEDLCGLLYSQDLAEIIFKPRGGAHGDSVVKAVVEKKADNSVDLTLPESAVSCRDAPSLLTQGSFDPRLNRYPGWVVQRVIRQHDFMNRLNPFSVNTIRVVTFIGLDGEVKIHHSVLRVGCGSHATDNWDKGGLSIGIDADSGKLGKGVRKREFGGQWTAFHPTSGVQFEGLIVPSWSSIIELCKSVALVFAGARSVGWDIALTPDGPIVLEGNADWGLPSVQAHGSGYLTGPVREQLAQYEAFFPQKASSLPRAVFNLSFKRIVKSRLGEGLLRFRRHRRRH